MLHPSEQASCALLPTLVHAQTSGSRKSAKEHQIVEDADKAPPVKPNESRQRESPSVFRRLNDAVHLSRSEYSTKSVIPVATSNYLGTS